MKRGCFPTMGSLSISHHHTHTHTTHTLTLHIQWIQKLGNDGRYTPPITRAKPRLSLWLMINEKKYTKKYLKHEENPYIQSQTVFHDSGMNRLLICYYYLLVKTYVHRTTMFLISYIGLISQIRMETRWNQSIPQTLHDTIPFELIYINMVRYPITVVVQKGFQFFLFYG